MQYFTDDYAQFFKELAANNHRDWFHANKKRYEKSVKEPFEAFVAALITEVQKDDKAVQIEPKQALFRIYKDVRFSKDKTPYKLNMSAVISPGGRKDMISPGMYIELSPEVLKVYGGLYQLDKEQLFAVRTYISNNLKKFDKLLNDKDFKSRFETISGAQHKRIPKEFQEVHEKQPLIANKAYYYFNKLSPDLLTSDKLLNIYMEHYYAGKPMKLFLAEAIKGGA